MHTDTHHRTRPGLASRVWFALTLAAALLLGCGGGGGAIDGGVGTGGTGSFASGPVTGFGSVIVNAVRFDDRGARVEDADGNLKSRDDLRLGMTVDVDSAEIVPASGTALATSTASRIRFSSEMVGAVEQVDAVAGTLSLLGQVVAINKATVFDDALPGGIAALSVGRAVEVYGQYDAATQRYLATRVAPAAAGAASVLRGIVSQLDLPSQTCRIGAAVFSYAGASSVPANLADGSFVRARLQAGTDASGHRVISSFKAAPSSLPDAGEASIKGLISSFVSSTSFSVNGQPVDATGASFKNGSAGLAVGVRVEVQGPVRDGVLRAQEVAIETEQETGNQEFEFEGAVSSVNAADGSFVLRAESRNVTIGTSRPDLRFDNGTAADLKMDAKVQVKGLLSTDGTRVEATRITFDK